MPAAGERADRSAQGLALARGVEAAFGGALLRAAPARCRRHAAAACSAISDHFRRRRHFEIERLVDAFLEPRDIVVDDVAAILAQMRGDAVGAGGDRDLGRRTGSGCRPPRALRTVAT